MASKRKKPNQETTQPNEHFTTIDIPSPEPGRALAVIAPAALAGLEIDKQIATAKEFPRDIVRVQRTSMQLVEQHLSMSDRSEDGLYYCLTRGGKKIEGPNVRLAEIIQHSYGNSRAGARPTHADDKYVYAEGVFHDLETNTAINMTVKRRITDREGHRYNDDMIGTTENAASAIAYRNAVLKGIPKAIWWPLYLRARKIEGGARPNETSTKRQAAVQMLQGKGVTLEQICNRLGVTKISDIGADELATLRGILTACANKETSLAKEFNLQSERTTSDVKSDAPNPEGALTANQVLDINTLIGDWNLTPNDVHIAMVGIGHKGALTALPQKLLVKLYKELEKRKK
jgi:hypothetical protein